MNRKLVKKIVAGATLSALCAVPTAAFAGGGVLGGNPASLEPLEGITEVTPVAVQYRSLYRNSFEDGTWNLISVKEVCDSVEYDGLYDRMAYYLSNPNTGKFVEAGLQDLPLDLGTFVVYDIKAMEEHGDDIQYAVKYAPKVTNAVSNGVNLSTDALISFSNSGSVHGSRGFKQEHYDEVDFSGFDDKILIAWDIAGEGARPIVGERVWTSSYVKNAKNSDGSVYLMLSNKDKATGPNRKGHGSNTSDIVGVKLHLEDKSYRNFDTVDTSSSLDNTVALNVNGEELSAEGSKPFVHQGTTLVPLRLAANTVGAEVGYEEADDQLGNRIKMSKDSSYIELFTKSNLMYKGETDIRKMSMAPVIVDGTSYVPVRAIAEAFGCEVGFDSATNTVLINS